jgi:hypothetical protein
LAAVASTSGVQPSTLSSWWLSVLLAHLASRLHHLWLKHHWVSSSPSCSPSDLLRPLGSLLVKHRPSVSDLSLPVLVVLRTTLSRFLASSSEVTCSTQRFVIYSFFMLEELLLTFRQGGNLGGKCGYVWGATGLICLITAFFYLPEMKGRSYREIDIMFNRRIPARKWKKTEIDMNDDE